MDVVLAEIGDVDLEAVLAISVFPRQERFVGTVRGALADAAAHPYANPWFRAVYAGDEPVGFVMLSWDVEPRPPVVIGPWFLWKLIIDRSRQRLGYGAQVVHLVADLVRDHGATELLTSYVDGDDGPAGFYARLGFQPTGDVDDTGETIVRLPLRDGVA
jgi:GNAT superfamily N-acetyltransferase